MISSTAARALLTAGMILLLAPVFDLEIELSVWLLPIVLMTAVSLASVGLVIGTWSPSWEVGITLANAAGIFIVLLSPIYFPISRLPDWMEPIARLSPYTYAAQALNAVLSGQGDFYLDTAILAGITAAALIVGVAGMRWREN